MYDTADTVQKLAAGANIVFTPDEAARVTAIWRAPAVARPRRR